MDYPDIGLDLFTAPFGGTVPTSKRETPKPQQPKTMVKQQAGATVTQTEIKASEQSMAVKNPEPMKPQPEAKASESAQSKTTVKDSESTQSKTDEKGS